jgi:hypothetical protein
MILAMHRDHQVFLDSLEEQRKVTLTFFSQDDGHNLVRTCAPMDFGPTRIAKDSFDRYHFWDFDSDEARHPLMLLPDQVVSFVPSDEGFDPVEFVTWETNWRHPRDWGEQS